MENIYYQFPKTATAPVIIETERLILRNYTMNDFEDYWQYVSNPNIGPRCGWPTYTDKDKAKDRLKIEVAKPYQLAIYIKSDKKVIGSIEIMTPKAERYPIEIEDTAKEIGFLLSEAYWGQGIMPEATQAAMKYAFEILDAASILISHAEPNTQSGRVQEKLGFKAIGTVKNYREWIDGKMCNSIYRKMTKEEWLSRKM